MTYEVWQTDGGGTVGQHIDELYKMGSLCTKRGEYDGLTLRQAKAVHFAVGQYGINAIVSDADGIVVVAS